MAKYKVDVRTNGLESGLVCAPFDESLAELRSQGHEPIEIGLNTTLIILEGLKSSIYPGWNYVKEGGVYLKGERGIIVRSSPLLYDPQMLQEAIRSNKQGQYFSTPNRELYEGFLKQVTEDASKAPRERRAILMPSDRPFQISQSVNPELFEFLQINQAYLDFMKQNHLISSPVISQDTLNDYLGTVLTQLWFSYDDSKSCLQGNDRSLDFCRIRGIRKIA